MKLGILTANRTNNNGTILQTAAMYKLFSYYEPQTEIIDYKCKKLEGSRRIFRIKEISDFAKIPAKLYSHIAYEKFRRKSFKASRKIVLPQDCMLDSYDTVVVGSDQIWNLNITGNDLNFFLPPSTGEFKRYSYAASIGEKSMLQWEEDYHLRAMLERFDEITVRENSGVSALQEIGVAGREILDPLLCLPKEKWAEMADSKPYHGSPYILLYMVERNEKMVDSVIRYGRKNGYKVIRIEGMRKPKRGIRTKSFVSIPAWLRLLMNTSLFVTNSYHGVAVAVASKVNFRVIPLQNYDHNCRSYDLLHKIGADDFTRNSSELLEDESACPDWDNIDQCLREYRAEAYSYIRRITENTSKKGEV